MPKLVFRLFTKDENFGSGMASAQKKLRRQSELFNNINKDSNRASQGMLKFGKALPLLKLGAMVAIMNRMSRSIETSIKASMDQIETQNLFNVALADTSVETGKAIDQISNLYGLDSTNIRNTIGTFALLGRSMGMTSDKASTLSLSTYQLGTDLASLTNIPIEQVMGDLRSGLLGQSETVYKYGMDVTESALKTEALAQGISKSVRSMSQGEKMALRYAVMIKTGAIAQGDFAKTIEEPANQMRILQERMVTLSRSIGSIFMPILGKVLPYLNAFAIVLTRVANSIARLVGFVPSTDENTANTFSNMAESAGEAEGAVSGVEKAVKKLRASVLGFDELNVMNAPTEATPSSGGSAIGGASILPEMDIGAYTSLMDNIPTKANEIADKIIDIFTGFWEKTGLSDISLSELFGDIDFTNLSTSLEGLLDAISPFTDDLFSGIGWFLENILSPLAEFTIENIIPSFLDVLSGALNVLSAILETFKPLGAWLWEELLSPMASFAGDVIVEFLNLLAEKLTTFSDWISDNQESVRTMTGIIAGFFGAWKLTELMAFIQMSGGLVKAIQAITTAIGLSTVAKLKDLAQTVALKIMYAGDFVKAVGAGTTALIKQIAQWGLLQVAKVKDLAQTILLKAMYFGDFLKSIVAGTGALIKQVAQWALLTTAKIFDAIKTAILTAGTWLMTAAQTALNLVLAINPIYLIITAIAGLIAILVTLYNKSEGFRNFVDKAFAGLKTFGNWIKNTFVKIWEDLGNVFSRVWRGIKSIFTTVINSMITGLNIYLKAVLLPFNAIIKGLNKIPSVNISTISVQIPKIPALAMGGIVESPTLSMIGEAGAEAVMPLNSNALQKYLAPVLGNNNISEEDMYGAVYRAFKDIERESEDENVFNLYIDGVHEKTVKELRRKNVRSGRVIVPVAGG